MSPKDDSFLVSWAKIVSKWMINVLMQNLQNRPIFDGPRFDLKSIIDWPKMVSLLPFKWSLKGDLFMVSWAKLSPKRWPKIERSSARKSWAVRLRKNNFWGSRANLKSIVDWPKIDFSFVSPRWILVNKTGVQIGMQIEPNTKAKKNIFNDSSTCKIHIKPFQLPAIHKWSFCLPHTHFFLMMVFLGRIMARILT